ncbi:MAG: helix-turn-helix transcriptional regulator [Eubacterium sp.]|nr:helix-turn-helix transcriptional regulator [Eubacterium sp.]
MPITPLKIKKEFDILALDCLHYLEYRSNFIFQSDYHENWHLIYVKKGSFEISSPRIKDTSLFLEQGDFFLECPGEYYSFRSASEDPVLLLCTGFVCKSSHLATMSCCRLPGDKEIHHLLSLFLEESRRSFSNRVNENGQFVLNRKYHQIMGSEQLACMYLEMLLLHLLKHFSAATPAIGLAGNELSEEGDSEKKKPEGTAGPGSDSILLRQITEYYASHILEGVSILELCAVFGIGRGHLQRIFREQTGCSAIDYFSRMRISVAKQMIQDDRMSLTETARALGFSSVSSFSRQFKNITGMPPSSYRQSVRTVEKNPLLRQIDFTSTGSPDTDPFPS